MKVSRQNLYEEYSTTASWLSDFQKNADYLDSLKSILNKRKEFNSIEEKMADIRDRAGFNLIKSNSESESSGLTSSAGECAPCSEGSGSCDSCGSKDDSIKIIKNILKYIADYHNDRPEVSLSVIITHCKGIPELGFHQIESKIDYEKFKKLVSKMLDLENKDQKEVEYTPEELDADEADDRMADYMRHAETSG